MMSKVYATLVFLRTDSELTGVGEGLTWLAPSALTGIVEELPVPVLLSRGPFEVERVWEEI